MIVLDYDDEAASYDATRGGEPRAAAAAQAITALLPPTTRSIVDLACGRGVWIASAPHLDEALAALPDQDRPRPDPVYTLLALRKPDHPGSSR